MFVDGTCVLTDVPNVACFLNLNFSLEFAIIILASLLYVKHILNIFFNSVIVLISLFTFSFKIFCKFT